MTLRMSRLEMIKILRTLCLCLASLKAVMKVLRCLLDASLVVLMGLGLEYAGVRLLLRLLAVSGRLLRTMILLVCRFNRFSSATVTFINTMSVVLIVVSIPRSETTVIVGVAMNTEYMPPMM